MEMIAENNQKNNGKWFAKSFAFYVNAILLVDLLRMVLYRFGGNSTIVEYIIYAAAGLYAYYCIFFKQHFILNKKYVKLIAFSILIVVISIFINTGITQAMGYFIPFFLIKIIPGCYYCFYLAEEDIKSVMSEMIKYRWIWVLYAIIGNWYIPLTTTVWNQYSMTFGYNLLIPVCILLFLGITEKKLKYFLYLIFLSAFILLRGSRGPLVCLIIFGIIYLFFANNGNFKGKKLVVLLFIGAFCACILLFSNYIIAALSNLFPSSRTVYYLTNNFFDDTGRSELSELVTNQIIKSPLSIRGVFSDRLLITTYKGEAFDITNYPHNIILEMFYQFGIPLGVIFLLFLTLQVIKSVFIVNHIHNNEFVCLWALLLASGLFRLFMSGSYLTCVEFYLFISFCLNMNYKNYYCDYEVNT